MSSQNHVIMKHLFHHKTHLQRRKMFSTLQDTKSFYSGQSISNLVDPLPPLSLDVTYVWPLWYYFDISQSKHLHLESSLTHWNPWNTSTYHNPFLHHYSVNLEEIFEENATPKFYNRSLEWHQLSRKKSHTHHTLRSQITVPPRFLFFGKFFGPPRC